MRDEWEDVALGQLIRRRSDFTSVNPDADYIILGVQRSGWGFVQREPLKGRDQKFTKLMRVEVDDLVYRTITAFEAPSAVAGPEQAGLFVTPQTFPVFRINSQRLLPAYMRLLTTWPKFHDEMATRCTGTVLRRKTLSVGAFESIPIPLPSPDEQRRIVDLIGALDDVAGALADAINAAQETRGFLLEALLARLPEATELKPMGSVGVFLRGRRFTKSDYVDEGLGCIHYGQIHTHLGSVTTHPLTLVPEEMRGRLRLASPGDVVVAATSEDVEGLGKATAWLGKDDVAVHDDCYIFRHSLDPRFATHLFASKGFQRQKVQFAAGTKVTRISGANLGRIEVPVPDLADQTVIGQTMSDLDATLDSLTLERSRLRSLRSHALAVLLSGEHEIPKSYDGLMEVPS